MEMTPHQYDNMKAALVKLLQTVYLQGMKDMKDVNPAFEDGFNCDANEMVDGILEEYIEVIG